MPRRRLGVVLLVPEPVATEIDGLRRAVGDPVLERIAPHLTLVPPVNVRVDEVGAALAVLRDAAAASRPFALELGPPRSFAPASDTLYLAVGGADDAMAALAELRDAVVAGPLHRLVDHDFVPHVTISPAIDGERAGAALTVLADYRARIDVASVHLLEQRHDTGRRWVPVADVPLGPRVIVGRGGVELELTRSTLVDPEGLALLAEADGAAAPGRPTGAGSDGDAIRRPGAPGSATVVVTARRRGSVVGVAQGERDGTTTEVRSVVVLDAERGQGIGRQLRLALESALADG